MPPPRAKTRSDPITGMTSQRPRPRSCWRTCTIIQIASVAIAGGHSQPRRSITAGPGWNVIRPSPIEPRNIAGTAVQPCGWALKRVERTAIRPQATPKAKRSDPVTSASEPAGAKVRRSATAKATPASSEPKIGRTGERLLVVRGASFMSASPGG
jgi:hypothetical protein